jgi:hypothetical protein
MTLKITGTPKRNIEKMVNIWIKPPDRNPSPTSSAIKTGKKRLGPASVAGLL